MNPGRGPGGGAEVARRAAVTVGAAVTYLVMSHVPLPFVLQLVPAFQGPTETLSLRALEMTPFLWAFVLVEAFALAVPALRARRHGGEEARRSLTHAAWLLGAGLAALQAYGVVATIRAARFDPWGAAAELGPLESAALAVTLVGGSLLSAWLAERVTCRGLGNGFAVLGAVAVLGELPRAVLSALGTSSQLPPLVLVLVAGVALGTMAGAARFVRRAPGAGVLVPVPTCGVIPLWVTTAALFVPVALQSYGFFPQLNRLADAVRDGETSGWLTLVLALALGVLFTALFSPAAQVEAAWDRAGVAADPAAVREALRRARRHSLGFLALLCAVPLLANLLGLGVTVGVGGLTALVGIGVAGMDVLEDARSRRAHPGLVTAYPLHRVFAVEPVLAALAAAGIPAVARNRYYRVLFHFFAPYVPVEICVPPERAEEAAALCARVAAGPEAPLPEQAAAAF